MNDKINEVLNKYLEQTNNLVKQFYNKYYNEKDEHIFWDEWEVVWNYEHWLGIIKISSYYWNIDTIFTALNDNVSEEILFSWYDNSCEYHSSNKHWDFTDLHTYNKNNELQKTDW